MARDLTPFRWLEIIILSLATVGLAAAIVVSIEAVPSFIADATLGRQAAIVGGLIVGLIVLYALVYRSLPQSRVR